MASLQALRHRAGQVLWVFAFLGASLVAAAPSAGYDILHHFKGGPADGAGPGAGLLLDGDTLYGTTRNGGGRNPSDALGTVFKLKTDGTGYEVLHHFKGGAADGAAPVTALILDGAGFLYGTTSEGGSADLGIVFKLKTDGAGFEILHHFEGGAADGAGPAAALLLDGDTLYGTTRNGGSADLGTVFTVKTDGTGFAILHQFAGGAAGDGFITARLADPRRGRFPLRDYI